MSDSGGRAFWQADVSMTTAATAIHDAAAITRPYDEAALDLTIAVTCYNEAEHIIETLDKTCEAAREVELSFEILVFDDCSTDGSGDLIREYIASHPLVNIVLRSNHTNKGLAQNYIDGAFLGKGKYYRLICGDSGEPKESTVRVFKSIGEADCIVPYYPTNSGRSVVRRLISKTYTSLINNISGNRIKYYNGLAVHLRHNVMRWHTNTKGFGFQSELLCRLLDLNFTYLEVPVDVPSSAFQRQDKQSTAMNARNMLSVLHTIMEIMNRRLSGFVYSKAASRKTRTCMDPFRPDTYQADISTAISGDSGQRRV